ncbi:MAG: hypothetical protein V4596_14240 [Bdellovibrionota bacterium]
MKIFSAQTNEHKEFSLIEFSSELVALPLINELAREVKLIDMFSLLNGNFVVFISCNNLKKTFERLKSHPSTIGGYFTNDTNMESLQAFYYLNKASISDTVIVLETEKFYKLFEVMDQAIKAGIQVLDLKNQRSFTKNTLYLTGELSKTKNFSAGFAQDKDVKCILIEKLSENLLNYI